MLDEIITYWFVFIAGFWLCYYFWHEEIKAGSSIIRDKKMFEEMQKRFRDYE